MWIVTGLFLILWAVMVNFMMNSGITHGMEAEAFYPFATLMSSQMGLQFSAMLVALLTIMMGAGAISQDVESGLIHGILAKPISRTSYILGKFLGLAALASIFASVLYVLIIVIGCLFDLSTFTSLSASQFIVGWFFYLLLPIAILCVTMFGSTIFKTVANGILMIFIYVLSSVGGMVEMVGNIINNDMVEASGVFISLLSPFQVIYNTMEEKLLDVSSLGSAVTTQAGMPMGGGGSPASPLMYVYIGLYMIFFIWLAVRTFNKKDIV